VRADPFDPHDVLLEIDGDDEPMVVALKVGHNAVCGDDAGVA
jgi:hypothetical protein